MPVVRKVGEMEKVFAVSITDKEGLTGEAKFRVPNKTAAMKAARQYIKAWGLGPATINCCEDVTKAENEQNQGGEES